MGQITEDFARRMLVHTANKQHPPLTVWEAEQLALAWLEREALRQERDRAAARIAELTQPAPFPYQLPAGWRVDNWTPDAWAGHLFDSFSKLMGSAHARGDLAEFEEIKAMRDSFSGMYRCLVSLAPQPTSEQIESGELPQPAPLALSAEDAMVWNARVQAAQVTTAKSCIDEAILAVDALLRRRVQRLTDGDPIAAEMTAVADQYAHRMAMHLECILLDYSGQWYDEAIETLGRYRADMNAIHERLSPTHMGEPVIEDRSDCHGPDWTDRDGEYLK